MKWGFIPQGDGKPHYLVVNADESEPGACKDMPTLLNNPQALIEGIIIACYAIRAEKAFIYVRGEVLHVIRRLQHAVAEAREAGYLGDNILGSDLTLDVVVHAGAGAYICGEETALLDSLEGLRGQPRLKPPFPAVAGLYACPTVVNNVESIATVPYILGHGAADFAAFGTEKSKGFGIFSLSGHVTTPGQYEAPLGTTLRELLDLAGGIRAGHRLKFWTPGGSSTPLFTDQHLDVPLDYESVAAAGSMLGTRSLQLFDETTCVVRVVLRWIQFYEHESCGKCTPCREGSYWVVQLLRPAGARRGQRGRPGQAAGHLRQHHRPSLLRPRRLDPGAGRILDQVLPGRVPRAPAASAAARSIPPHRRSLPWSRPDDSPALEPSSPAGELVKPADGVNVTIDGFEITVPKGTLIIRAAEQLGIQIPRFCDHPLLDPVGACRQCLVQVEGQPKPPASCTTTVTDGMVVRTQLTSPVAEKAQRGMMELLLVNHPLDCPMCDKGGECPLQNQAMSTGQGETRFHGAKRTFAKPIALSTQVLLDRERCIQCARCTRFADQIAGDPLIELLERGPQEQVGVADGVPFDSYFSGNTVQICPVGALTGASYRFRARPFDLVSTPERVRALRGWLPAAHRPPPRRGHPAAGRQRARRSTRSGTATRAGGRSPTPPSRTGWSSPLVRDADGVLQPASWPEALFAAARRAARGARPGRRAARRAAHAGGRLRLRQVRPGGAGQQRHRHAGQAALGRGTPVPGRACGRPGGAELRRA